jgi:hypothetical protein
MYKISTRLYRLLLRLYPVNFRRVYGDLMTQAFRDRLRDARRDGIIATVLYWLHTLYDVMVNALGERMAATQKRSLKYWALHGTSFIALFLSYPLLWYGILAILLLYAEPTGDSGPAGTVQYYVALLVRIQILWYGMPVLVVVISLLIAGHRVIHSPRIAPRWLIAISNTIVAPLALLLFYPVTELVYRLGLVELGTHGILPYYPPAAFLIWVPMLLGQIVFVLWLHYRIMRWMLRSNEEVVIT